MRLNTENIQLIKARKNICTRQVADAYGCSRSFINMVIKKKNVRAETAGKLAKALGCDVTEIIEVEK